MHTWCGGVPLVNRPAVAAGRAARCSLITCLAENVPEYYPAGTNYRIAQAPRRRPSEGEPAATSPGLAQPAHVLRPLESAAWNSE